MAVAVERQQAKRDHVLEHAIEVFAAQGFRRADVQVIADNAAVGKGTVYRYFGSKEDLFWAATYRVLEHLWESLHKATGGANGRSKRCVPRGWRMPSSFWPIRPTWRSSCRIGRSSAVRFPTRTRYFTSR